MTAPVHDVAAVLLAAGYARRFGSDKRRLPFAPHSSLMGAALAPLQAVFQRVIVVLPPGDAWGALQCRQHGVEVAWSFWQHQGLAASLAAALPAVGPAAGAHHPVPGAMLVALADMGCVQPATLLELVQAWRNAPDRLVLPRCQGQPGNPRIIPAPLWPLLAGATGDDGVRRALPWAQAQVLETADTGVLQDVDTQQDAQRLRQVPPASHIPH